MYSPASSGSSRALHNHSPVHRLHSRPPTSLRRFLPSSRSLRLHPIFLIPIFLLGTLFSPFTSSPGAADRQLEPVYNRDDYAFDPDVAFAAPDAPPLLLVDDDGDESGHLFGKATSDRVLARDSHGEGQDESEWWDPAVTSSRLDPTGPFFERDGLLYFSSTRNTIPRLEPAPEFPLARPRTNPPLNLPSKNDPRRPPAAPRVPEPPSDWLVPGDLFKAPSERTKAQPRAKPAAPLAAGVKPPGAAKRVPIRDRIPLHEREALKRKIGQNAQMAQLAKKEGKPFRPNKPQELVLAELEYEKEKERKRKEDEDARFRQAVWAQVLPDDDKRVLGLDDDDALSRQQGVADEDDGELSDEAILEAVKDLSPQERSLLSVEEQDIIRELELKYPHLVQRPLQQPQQPRRGNFRDRAHDQEKPVFNPLNAAGRGPKGKRSEIILPETGDEEDTASQFVRRAIAPDDDDNDKPSLSNSDLTAREIKKDVPDRIHPIEYLVEQAEERWQDMLRRQSQTLEQAVEEYERRYGFKPPVGFDSWWRYAMENRVVLVDEYDQIHLDLLPFRALAPAEFRKRSAALQTDSRLPWFKHSFGLGIKSGAVKKYTTGGSGGGGPRMEDLMDILGEFAEMLPEDVEMRFMTGDEPGVVISGEARQLYEQYAGEGKYLSNEQATDTFEPNGLNPWESLCAPNSTARRVAEALPVDTPRGTHLHSFVNLEHEKSMSLCDHPELKDLNGFTSWSGPRPYLLYPMFSFAKTSVHADLLVPSISNDYYTPVGKDPTWEGKRHNKVLWRGESTGAWHAKGTGWRSAQRARLVTLANSDQERDQLVHFASTKHADSIRASVVPSASSVTSFYLDVAYVGGPVQCAHSSEDKTCSDMLHDPKLRWDEKGYKTPEEENMYKYVLDVDANYPSGKFKRYMSSRSLVFKSTIFPEWYSKRIMPWYHYIPIKSDYSDLVDVAAFFIGAPDGTNAHDKLAKRLAINGQKWSNEHWREVDMAAYMFRLYLEYARLLHRDENDPTSMDYSP
ncbi:uncharacterized protein JCM15063_004996 [Sporobolomyces koalae]|uniref:uncharacterized protein n=1 Tax=Sporobolomyces koalae TaxID=500713 RepID=UPI003171E87F